MYLRATKNTIDHVKMLIEMNNNKLNDQQILNSNLRFLPLSYSMLDFERFIAGVLFFDKKFLNNPPSTKINKIRNKIKAENAIFIHANHMVGNDKKIAALKSENLWFI